MLLQKYHHMVRNPPNCFQSGRKKMDIVHKPHNFQVTRSAPTVLRKRILKLMISPSTIGSTNPLPVIAQKRGVSSDQIMIGTAIVQRASLSPKTIGTVLRSRVRSPSWSLRSWTCSVEKIMAALIASHWYPRGVISGLPLRRPVWIVTCVVPKLATTMASALITFRTT